MDINVTVVVGGHDGTFYVMDFRNGIMVGIHSILFSAGHHDTKPI